MLTKGEETQAATCTITLVTHQLNYLSHNRKSPSTISSNTSEVVDVIKLEFSLSKCRWPLEALLSFSLFLWIQELNTVIDVYFKKIRIQKENET